MIDKLKAPPRDVDAEYNFLGAIIEEPERYAEAMKAVQLKPEDFFNKTNALAFSYIQTMYSEGVKQIDWQHFKSIATRLGTIGQFDGTFKSAVFVYSALASDAVHYAKLIKEYSKKRESLGIAEEFIDSVYSQTSANDKAFEQALAKLNTDTYSLINDLNQDAHKGPRPACDVFSGWYKDAVEAAERGENAGGAPTGFTGLDNMITGLKPGTMNIFAAQPGIGKTALGLNLLENILKDPANSKPAVVFSIEMTAEMVVWRVVSAFTNIPVQRFQNFTLTASDAGRMREFEQRPADFSVMAKLYIDDESEMTPAKMSQRCRQIADRHGGISAILVDHVQIMSGDQKTYQSDVQKYGEISRKLKGLSKDLKCPVIVLSQLSRKIDDRKDHEPKNSDLKETSCLEQDADLIAFIQRDMSNPEDGKAKLKITKNRHGAMGEVELAYNNQLTLFTNPDREY